MPEKVESLEEGFTGHDDLPPEVLAIAFDDDASDWLRGSFWHLLLRCNPSDAEEDAKRLHDAMTAWSHYVKKSAVAH
jgi:hypothetical protein